MLLGRVRPKPTPGRCVSLDQNFIPHLRTTLLIDATCHCGAVRLTIDAAPTEVTDCNCSICRRYGVVWAYYSPAQVQLIPPDAATDVYMWGDRTIAFTAAKPAAASPTGSRSIPLQTVWA